MLSQLILNFFASLFALSLTSSVAFHDSRLDTAFLSLASTSGDTSSHDFTHAVNHDLHVHSNRQTVNGNEPTIALRLHKKHVAAHHSRVKLSALSV